MEALPEENARIVYGRTMRAHKMQNYIYPQTYPNKRTSKGGKNLNAGVKIMLNGLRKSLPV